MGIPVQCQSIHTLKCSAGPDWLAIPRATMSRKHLYQVSAAPLQAAGRDKEKMLRDEQVCIYNMLHIIVKSKADQFQRSSGAR